MFPFLAPLSKAFARMTTAELDDVWRHIQQLTPGEDELMAAQLTSGPSAGDVAQPGAPTVTGSYITNGGATLTVVFSEPVTGSTGFIVAGTALTYASGSGSSQLVYTLSPPVPANATTYLSYGNTPGNVTDTTGTALAGFSGMPVTNNGTSPPPLPVANRYAWKRRSFDVDGKRIDHPDGMTGSSTWMPAYEPNNRTLSSGTEVWLRRKLTTASAGVMFEIVGAGSSTSTVTMGGGFLGLTPAGPADPTYGTPLPTYPGVGGFNHVSAGGNVLTNGPPGYKYLVLAGVMLTYRAGSSGGTVYATGPVTTGWTVGSTGTQPNIYGPLFVTPPPIFLPNSFVDVPTPVSIQATLLIDNTGPLAGNISVAFSVGLNVNTGTQIYQQTNGTAILANSGGWIRFS